MGFSYSRPPTEPILHRCKFCGKSIRWISSHTSKAPGYVHVGFTRGVADWVLCSGPSSPEAA